MKTMLRCRWCRDALIHLSSGARTCPTCDLIPDHPSLRGGVSDGGDR